MTDRVRYEALVRRYERMSVARPGYPVGADGPFPAHICVGSVRLPVQMEGGRLSRYYIRYMLKERICALKEFRCLNPRLLSLSLIAPRA